MRVVIIRRTVGRPRSFPERNSCLVSSAATRYAREYVLLHKNYILHPRASLQRYKSVFTTRPGRTARAPIIISPRTRFIPDDPDDCDTVHRLYAVQPLTHANVFSAVQVHRPDGSNVYSHLGKLKFCRHYIEFLLFFFFTYKINLIPSSCKPLQISIK
jgi:hypothetical protein